MLRGLLLPRRLRQRHLRSPVLNFKGGGWFADGYSKREVASHGNAICFYCGDEYIWPDATIAGTNLHDCEPSRIFTRARERRARRVHSSAAAQDVCVTVRAVGMENPLPGD